MLSLESNVLLLQSSTVVLTCPVLLLLLQASTTFDHLSAAHKDESVASLFSTDAKRISHYIVRGGHLHSIVWRPMLCLRQ